MAIGPKLRFEIFRRDDFRCRYCLAYDQPLVVDHVIPQACQGSDHPSNLVTACVDCNAGKGATPLWADKLPDVDPYNLRPQLAVEKARLDDFMARVFPGHVAATDGS